MILEGAQLLASAHHTYGSSHPSLYRLTHKNHPCAAWVRSSVHNYNYLLSLMEALNTEAMGRYGHNKTHLSLQKAYEWGTPYHMPDVPFTEPPKCVHDDFKGIEDTVDAYRSYYRRDKRDIATWTNREKPVWF